jgi:signal transduction histidine kinase
LVGLVVHDLRTPVAIIKAYAQLLEAQLWRTQKRSTAGSAHEIAAHILEQADLMADLVDTMLAADHGGNGSDGTPEPEATVERE